MTPVNVSPDVEKKKSAPADLVSTQVGANPKYMVRTGARQSQKSKGATT